MSDERVFETEESERQCAVEHISDYVQIGYVNRLPDYVLELIFTFINPYQDYDNSRLVCRRWNRVAQTALQRMKRLFYHKCNNFTWRLIEEESVGHGHVLSERCSHSACYHPADQTMYMFGGCTSSYTAFNDLWIFKLSTREWDRVIISKPPLPSAKALASLVLYNDNLILYGGFSKSSMNPIHQTTTFYKEIHMFNKSRNCWEEIMCENTAPHLAGHTASIVSDFMLVFGGSMGSSYNNNVYVLDITRRIWNMPCIPGPCPPPRYGQSQILLDEKHLVIIGGCGGPSVMFTDVWLLDFDLCGDTEWKWTQLKTENTDLTPPYMWCHRACKVGQNAVVLSRPTKYNMKRTKRRRASSQSTTVSGCHRISSPDSPQDRRAVAAAFHSNSVLQQANPSENRKFGGRSDDVGSKRKPLLLSSRSLDEHDQKGSHDTRPSPNSAQVNNNSNSHANGASITSGAAPSKSSELHRACSIPAIIVGEIPKLIVTSSNDPQLSQQKASPPGLVVLEDGTKCFMDGKNTSTSRMNSFSSSNSVFEDSASNALDASLDQPECSDFRGGTKSSSHTIAVHEYYLSLLKEEYNRLKIVELAENLVQVDEKLDSFLSERVPYLSSQERRKMIHEFFHSNDLDSDDDSPLLRRRGDLGQLAGGKNRQIPGRSSTESNRNSLDSTPSSSSRRPSLNESNLFGQIYYRHMCAYVLRMDKAIEHKVVCWEQLDVEDDAPEDIILYSIVAARGELIMFGGMRSDGGNGLGDCLNVGMDRHLLLSDTFLLRPRYSEM